MGLNKTKRPNDWCPDESFVQTEGKRKIHRCPSCNKRLLPQLVTTDALELMKGTSEIDGMYAWKIPPHKAK